MHLLLTGGVAAVTSEVPSDHEPFRDDPDWTVDSLRPWVRGCIDAFGPERCMFASNWPIDRLHGTYVDLLAAYDVLTADLSAGDREAMFAGTARRTYRL